MNLHRLSRLNTASWRVLGVALLALLVAGSAFAVPRPTIYGSFATTNIDGPVIFWQPLQLNYEADRITLNVTAPCGDFSTTFDPTDTPFFDVGKLTGEVDGTYSYELVVTPRIDPGVQEELTNSRGSGKEQALLQSFWDKGLLPQGPFRQAGFFEVARGLIVPQDSTEEGAKSLSGEPRLESQRIGVDSAEGAVQNVSAAQTIAQSLCVGFDCVASPSFSDSTILLTENNTRIKFDDTSTAGSFPRNDWEIEANSNLNGGGSYLAINDCGQSSQGGCADDPVFLVEAGARRHALYVENSGEVGIGTANPVLELHAVSGDTPGLRLEQDTSSGFAAQTWDLAGNETSFFLRDATNGSTLPFRVRPGASSNSLVIDTDDDIGIGVLSPGARLDIRDTSSATVAINMWNSGSSAGDHWEYTAVEGLTDHFLINKVGSGSQEFRLDQGGNLSISGTLTANGSTFPDYVFEKDYSLMPLQQLSEYIEKHKHLPRIPSAKEVEAQGGHNMTELQLRLLEKVEELTLYTLEQEEALVQFKQQNEALMERLAELEQALASEVPGKD